MKNKNFEAVDAGVSLGTSTVGQYTGSTNIE